VKRNSALFVVIASAIFMFMGSVILIVLTADGVIQPMGVVLGGGLGFWVAMAFMIGREFYGRKKNVFGLILLMLVALIVGLVYQLVWQLPYIETHRTITGFFEQISGMIWTLSLASVYLSFQNYRKAER
jgi:hypothetical protein